MRCLIVQQHVLLSSTKSALLVKIFVSIFDFVKNIKFFVPFT